MKPRPRSRPRHGFGAHLLLGLGLLRERWLGPLGRWRTAGTRRGDHAIRTTILLGAAALVVMLLCAAWPLLLAAALTVTVLALRAATRHVTTQRSTAPPTSPGGPGEAAPGAPAQTSADAPEDDGQEQLADPTPEMFLALLHRVIGTAGGVHLRTLAAALTQQYGGTWTIPDVRRLAEAAGQPTRPAVRAPGAGPTVGIHRDDLLPLPRPTAPAPGCPVVVAGQPTTTPATTGGGTTPATPTTTVVGEQRITIAPDPDHPTRHTVRVAPARRRRP